MKTINWKPVQRFRTDRADGILRVLIDSGAIEAFKGENRVIDLGSGQGEIPLAISKKTGCSFTCVDKYSDSSEKVKREAEGKILWLREDAIEYLKKRKENSVDGITIFYSLQIFPSNKQSELLREIVRVVKPKGKVLIVEERKRKWPGRWVDIAMNKFLNVFNKQRYEIYSEETWKTLFEMVGMFPAIQKYKFGRNSVLFVFQL